MTKMEDFENDDDEEEEIILGGARGSHAQLSAKASDIDISARGGGAAPMNAGDIDNVVIDEMVDINKFRYTNKLSNIIYSTCPIIPKFHTTFGEPIDR